MSKDVVPVFILLLVSFGIVAALLAPQKHFTDSSKRQMKQTDVDNGV